MVILCLCTCSNLIGVFAGLMLFSLSGNNTWSGGDTRRSSDRNSNRSTGRSNLSQRAHDVTRQHQLASSRKSYGVVGEGNSRGWNLDYNSEDESTIVP